ncbi:MAG: Tfp pilus assembly protein FimT/FimU [Burkholderiales bacterium]
MNRKQIGFTLLEVAVAVALVGLMLVVAIAELSPFLRAPSESDIKERLDRNALILAYFYQQNATAIETNAAQSFGIASLIADNTNGVGAPATLTMLTTIANTQGVSVNDLVRDPKQGILQYFVSPQQTVTLPSGAQFSYRRIAIVSPGYNSAIDAGTAFSAAGQLTLGGDDIGRVVDGLVVLRPLVEDTLGRVQKLTTAYQNYFTNRYQANALRDVSVDYFANTGTTPARWDAGGQIGSSGGNFVAANTLNMAQGLGLSNSDMTTQFGGAIEVDNSSNNTRNPDNTTAAMQIPPYSALVRTVLPGGFIYQQSAIGSF